MLSSSPISRQEDFRTVRITKITRAETEERSSLALGPETIAKRTLDWRCRYRVPIAHVMAVTQVRVRCPCWLAYLRFMQRASPHCSPMVEFIRR